jgi:3-oxoacyl-[acyl-carrier protein] reductase
MDYELDGDTALVAASSSGLGKASAKALAKRGANVVINGRNEARLEEAAEEMRAGVEGDVVPVQGDLTDPDDITRLVEGTIDEFGRLDHLVTNAGGPPQRRVPGDGRR